MSWIVTPQLKVLNGVTQESILGIPFGGGYFAGYISHTADGNPTHALIVAPAAAGATGTGYPVTTNLTWKTATTLTTGTSSAFNGAANTAAMVTAGIADHPAAEFCVNLSIGGFNDWYLPAPWELDIAYFNLKPTTSTSNVNSGNNPYSVPRRNSFYTVTGVPQTAATLFQGGQSEAFPAAQGWASQEASTSFAYGYSFANGLFGTPGKTTQLPVRAFRRIAL